MKIALLVAEILEEQYIINPYFRTHNDWHRDQSTDPCYQDEATETDIEYANSLIKAIISNLKADAEDLEQVLWKE